VGRLAKLSPPSPAQQSSIAGLIGVSNHFRRGTHMSRQPGCLRGLDSVGRGVGEGAHDDAIDVGRGGERVVSVETGVIGRRLGPRSSAVAFSAHGLARASGLAGERARPAACGVADQHNRQSRRSTSFQSTPASHYRARRQRGQDRLADPRGSTWCQSGHRLSVPKVVLNRRIDTRVPNQVPIRRPRISVVRG